MDGAKQASTVWPLTADVSTVRSIVDGRKRQLRVLASSRLCACRAGDRILIREAGIPGLTDPFTRRDMTTSPQKAQFFAYPDGWRQYRDGTGRSGPRPNGAVLNWIPAVHVPRWASRVRLRVHDVRRQRLAEISHADILSTGLRRVAFGMLWRWPSPAPGLWRDPLAAFAARWDLTHGTPGERWADNPEVIVLDVQRDA